MEKGVVNPTELNIEVVHLVASAVFFAFLTEYLLLLLFFFIFYMIQTVL